MNKREEEYPIHFRDGPYSAKEQAIILGSVGRVVKEDLRGHWYLKRRRKGGHKIVWTQSNLKQL